MILKGQNTEGKYLITEMEERVRRCVSREEIVSIIARLEADLIQNKRILAMIDAGKTGEVLPLQQKPSLRGTGSSTPDAGGVTSTLTLDDGAN